MFFCQLSPKTFGIYSNFREKIGMLCIFVLRILWKTQNNQILDATWKRLLRNDLKCWQFKCSVSHNYSSPLGLLNWLITGSWHQFKSGVETHSGNFLIRQTEKPHFQLQRESECRALRGSCTRTLVCQKHKCWGRSSCSSAGAVVWASLSLQKH